MSDKTRSEKTYARLVSLFPASFRKTHGEDALQLFRDRLREETGLLRRSRLWFDILVDLVISIPRLHRQTHPELAATSASNSESAPFFITLEDQPLRPAAIVSGCAIALVAFSLIGFLMTLSAKLRGSESGAVHSDSNPVKWPTPPAEGKPAAQAAGADGNSPSQSKLNSRLNSMLGPERQRVLDSVRANVEQHYFDPAVAKRMADVLLAHQQKGADATATGGTEFAALLTTQLRDASHDLHVEVVYTATPPPQSSPDPNRMMNSTREGNCSFSKVQILPHNIGYLKLDAFQAPSNCGATATAAMASLNNVDALIFDLRDNRGGASEMVNLLASYLFDHPAYLFDPRNIATKKDWTSSPVRGNKLADKPVYILSSSTTISASEQFTYNLKMLKRAIIVGETTAGGAHAGIFHRIDDQFGVAIPETKVANPYGQADWEGTGIQPDIQVPASAALDAALKQIQEKKASVQHD